MADTNPREIIDSLKRPDIEILESVGIVITGTTTDAELVAHVQALMERIQEAIAPVVEALAETARTVVVYFEELAASNGYESVDALRVAMEQHART